MPDSGYTPSMEDIRLGFACYSDNRDMSLYKYDREAGDREWERIRDGAFAQFDRALAAHDAAIRKDQAKKDAAIATRTIGVDRPRCRGGCCNPDVAILSQSFTGTEKN